MSVFRVQKTTNYTVMSNCHLKDKNLTLKAKGLLSVMLSLPDNWDYSINGLVAISKENITAIRSALNELKQYGYLQIIKKHIDGRIDWDYNVYEKPLQEDEIQHIENLHIETQHIENHTQVSNKQSNTKKVNTKEITINSNLQKSQIIETPKKKSNKFDIKTFENMKSLIFSMFENNELQNTLLKYFSQRRPKRLDINQWQIILDDLKNYCSTDSERIQSVRNAIAGGYMVIIPSWEKKNNKKQNTLGNINRTSKLDNEKTYSEMTKEEKEKWEDENLAKDENGKFLEF